MAKEDCGQFKQGYLDYIGYEDLSEQERNDRYYEVEEKNLGWIYASYSLDLQATEIAEKEARIEVENKTMMPVIIERREYDTY